MTTTGVSKGSVTTSLNRQVSNTIGDEYHYVLECPYPAIKTVRNDVLSRYYKIRPSMQKFVQLMESISCNVIIAIKVGKLVREIMKVVT